MLSRHCAVRSVVRNQFGAIAVNLAKLQPASSYAEVGVGLVQEALVARVEAPADGSGVLKIRVAGFDFDVGHGIDDVLYGIDWRLAAI